MLRFRLFGIPFEVGLYFWIFTAILGSNLAHGDDAIMLLAIWAACVFVSIVVHELGHAVMARQFGIIPRVELHSFGGTTFFSSGSLSRSQSALVTLAGPAAGFALWALVRFGVVGLLDRVGTGHYTATAVSILIFINLYWTLFNLLPILPLDGGQLVRSLAGPRHLSAVRVLGGTVALIVAIYCLTIGQVYAGIFLGLLAVRNFRSGNSQPL